MARTNRTVAPQNRTNRAQSVRECSGDQKENARAAVAEPGVNHDKKTASVRVHNTSRRHRSAMSMFAKGIAAISSLFHYLTRLLMLDPAIALWIFLPAFYFSFKWFLVSLSVMIEAYFSFLGVYKLFDIRGCPVREEVVRKYGRNS